MPPGAVGAERPAGLHRGRWHHVAMIAVGIASALGETNEKEIERVIIVGQLIAHSAAAPPCRLLGTAISMSPTFSRA